MGQQLRRGFFWVHLGVGLLVSLFFLIMSGTGVLLAYRPQLEGMLNHWGVSSHPPMPGAPPLPIETIAERVREMTASTPQSVTVYPGSRRTVDVYLGRRAGTVYVDAYTGAVIGHPSPVVFGFFTGLMDWHTAMGIHGRDHFGKALIDSANLLSFGVIVIGLYLWLPRNWTWRHLKPVLLFRPGLTGKARDFNWHNVIGFWTLLPLGIMVWSGVALSYSWADRLTIQSVAFFQQPVISQPRMPTTGFTDADVEPDPFLARIAGLHALLERAKSRVPGWGSIEFTIPDFMSEPVTFTIDPTGYHLIKGGTSSRLQLARSGEELGFQGPATVNGRRVYRFAHTGELWGQWGQTIAMLGCLGGVFLVWTGASLSVRRFRLFARKARSQEILPQPTNLL